MLTIRDYRGKVLDILEEAQRKYGELIKEAVGDEVRVHILVKNKPAVDKAYEYLKSIGINFAPARVNRFIRVHSIEVAVPESDFGIDFEWIFPPG